MLLAGVCSNALAQRGSPKGINYDGDSWDGGSRGGFGDSGGDAGFGVALNLGYDVPTASLGKVFKAAPTYGLSILNNWKSFTFNLSAGYLSYSPKMGAIPYDPTDPASAYFQQGPFKIYQFYGGAAYNIRAGDMLKIYPGVNFGVFYTRDKYMLVDGTELTTVTTTVQNMYVAGKLGFIYSLTDQIGLGLEARGNFFTPSGTRNSRTGGEGGGGGYGSYTANVMLTYNF